MRILNMIGGKCLKRTGHVLVYNMKILGSIVPSLYDGGLKLFNTPESFLNKCYYFMTLKVISVYQRSELQADQFSIQSLLSQSHTEHPEIVPLLLDMVFSCLMNLCPSLFQRYSTSLKHSFNTRSSYSSVAN